MTGRVTSGDVCLALGLALLVVLMHLPGLDQSPARHADEGVYIERAWSLRSRGELAPTPYWYDHPPLGSLLLAGWATIQSLFLDSSGLASGRLLAVMCLGASSGLLFLLARRLSLGRLAAGLAVALFVLSPLAFYQQRQVFLDNLAMPWILASLIAASSSGRRRSWLAGGLLGIACLIKEVSLIYGPVVALFLLAQRSDDEGGAGDDGKGPARNVRTALIPAVVGMLAVTAAYPMLALARGELVTFSAEEGPSLLRGIHFQLAGRAASGSVLDPASPRRQAIRFWLSLDPWLVGLAVVLLVPALRVRRLRPVATGAAISLIAVVRPGYVPTMFVVLALPFLALVVVGTGDALLRRARGRPWSRLVQVVAAIGAVGLLSTWVPKDLAHAGNEGDHRYTATLAWVAANVDRDTTILADSTLWLGLVEAGFPPERIIQTQEFEGNLAARGTTPDVLPNGAVVIETRSMRTALERGGERSDGLLRRTRSALSRSAVVAEFGRRGGRVTVHRLLDQPPRNREESQ